MEKLTVQTEGSRLPAGSTLEIQPGVHVPHPHAEVNLPGIPDQRYAGSPAVTESALIAVDGKTVAVTTKAIGEVRPLAAEVIPSTLTTMVGGDIAIAKVGEGQTLVEVPQTGAGAAVVAEETKSE